MITAEEIAHALGARANGDGWVANCIAHDDETPSLSISESDEGKVLVKCHAGCPQSAVIDALRERGLWQASEPASGISVSILANAKHLPEPLLRESGFADDTFKGRQVVRIEYRGLDGELCCVRYRGSVDKGGARFWFRKGDKQQLFGLWRLRADEPVILVEGETDTVALWSEGFNAIGVPGAEAWHEKRMAPALQRAPLIYVHVEPDQGGEAFKAKLAKSALAERIRFFSVAPAAKDPCELRGRDPDVFRSAVETLIANATAAAEIAAEEQARPGTSDDELAMRFTKRHERDVRYVPAWDRWLLWDGARWKHDEKRRVFDLARSLCRSVLQEQLENGDLTETQTKALRNRLGSATTIYSVVRLAGTDPRHAVSVNQLDADPWVLNTPGGIVDLRTGDIWPHDPSALHTKVTEATPSGTCPLFLSVLERAQPDHGVREYLQRIAGYGMTGSSRDHVLCFWHGDGRNSKGTIAHAIRRALGDYGLEVASELFMESHHDRHPTELAVLHGARLVVSSEIDNGRRWNESRLKRLTGGDPISARYIGKDLFEFEPTHTFVIFANAKPGLRSVDEAIRGRMHLVPWAVKIPEAERDTTLSDRLKAEYAGILAWALKGCLEWQRIGLKPPEAVQAATAAYLVGEDMLQSWVDECTVKGGQISLMAAHRSYREWSERNGGVVLGRNSFGDQLEARGFKRSKESRSGKPVFVGLSMPQDPDPWTDR